MAQLVEYLNPPGAAPAQGLYAHVGRAVDSNLLFVAGQLSVAPDGSVAGKGDIEKFMELRAEMFPKLFSGPLYPPNTLLIVNRLVKEAFVFEVEAIVRAPGP